MDLFEEEDFTLSDEELSQLREEVRIAAPEETEEAEFFPLTEDTFPSEEDPAPAPEETFEADDTQILSRTPSAMASQETREPTIEELAPSPAPAEISLELRTEIRRLEGELSSARRELELMGWLMDQKDQLLEEVQSAKRSAERQTEYLRMDVKRDRLRADDLSSQLVQVQVYLSQPWWRRISKPVLQLTDS